MTDIFITSDFFSTATDEIEDKHVNDVKNDGSAIAPSTKFIDFINRLEGWKTKCKNLHWASHKRNVHKYLDDFLEIISSYQDELAEEVMGIYNRFGPNIIYGHPCSVMNAKEFIEEVRMSTLVFYKGIPEDAEYAGIKSECETFIHNINKYRYLFSLTDQEFKE